MPRTDEQPVEAPQHGGADDDGGQADDDGAAAHVDVREALVLGQQTARQRHKTEDEVRALVAQWMEQKPLDLLAGCRYPHVQPLFAGLRAAGKQIAVFSDYPARDKLAALGLQAQPIVCATDVGIARLKPDPCGLLAILRQTGVPATRALMIGDRFDRDAAAASRAGMRALVRARQLHPQIDTFCAYDDAVFQPMLMRAPMPTAA